MQQENGVNVSREYAYESHKIIALIDFWLNTTKIPPDNRKYMLTIFDIQRQPAN